MPFIPKSIYTVVGLTARGVVQRRPDGIHSLKICPRNPVFSKDSDAICKAGVAQKQPGFQSTQCSRLLDARDYMQSTNAFVNAVLVTLKPGHTPDRVARSIRRWKRLTLRARMENILSSTD